MSKKSKTETEVTMYPRYGSDYPLDPLTYDELERAVSILHENENFTASLRFVDITLKEPTKKMMAAYQRGDSFEREADVVLLDNENEITIEAVVSLSQNRVLEFADTKEVGQPLIVQDEFIEMTMVCMQNEEVIRALEKRGLDISQRGQVQIDPLSFGYFDDEFEDADNHQRRLVRGYFLARNEANDNAYAHPIEGLMVTVDLHKQEVVEVFDSGVVPVPETMRNYERQYIEKFRDRPKPIEITQPEGVNYKVEGWRVDWQRWSFRIGFNLREGLVLHDIRYNDVDKGEVREICRRASIAEMTVPYCDASPTSSRKNAFDVGEYGLGGLANSLTLGCDCLGEIKYFDFDFINAFGEIESIPHAVCMHEEDDSILWKHTDLRTERVENRRSTKLILSFIATVGNYEYGFYWVFRQDGSIELEVKALGVMQTGALKEGETAKFGTLVEDRVYAVNHQHFFCARLDMTIDGEKNQVVETESLADPIGETNPYGNAFYTKTTVFKTEQEAQRRHKYETVRTWTIQNPNNKNRMGANPGYRIQPMEVVSPFFQEGSVIHRRAGFLLNHLWVTPYNEKEYFPAGQYPNQNPGPDGLPKWTEQNRNIENEDIVVWYCFGHHHVPRLEDWPMMPTAKLGFMLKPSGFFDTSPCLDLPPAKCDPCCETEDGYVPMRRSKRMRRTIRYENLKAEEEQRRKDSKKS
tara:strand:+ start:2604 stop:4688 length:2085 start_codon:yes stop_codon:yes gene_type:complete